MTGMSTGTSRGRSTSGTNGLAVAGFACGIVGLFGLLIAFVASSGGFNWYVGG
ncbi:hypothetical protein ACFYVL_30830 [Streptomyces sp. NPDC004111]|uniref:hypothetical protein n=1 Tax=Streptomyces sp. NPDC004111 TaxID=3364690 RepID=UPI00368E5282